MTQSVECSKCGCVGWHACVGRRLPPPTPEDEARLSETLDKIFGQKPEMSEFVKWALDSIEKQLDKLSKSTESWAGTEIANLIVEKARLKANPQEEWKCQYNPSIHGRGRR